MKSSPKKSVSKTSITKLKNYLRISKNNKMEKRITRSTGINVKLPYYALENIEKKYREKKKRLNELKKMYDNSDSDVEVDVLDNNMSNDEMSYDDSDIEYDYLGDDKSSEVEIVEIIKPKNVIDNTDSDDSSNDDFTNEKYLKKNQNRPKGSIRDSSEKVYKSSNKVSKKVDEKPIAHRRERRNVKKPEVLDPSHKPSSTKKDSNSNISKKVPKNTSRNKSNKDSEYKGLKLNKKSLNAEYIRIFKAQKCLCNLCKCELDEYDDGQIDHIVQQQEFYEDIYGKEILQSLYNKHILCTSCHKAFKSDDVDIIANNMLKEKNPILSNYIDFRNFILNQLSKKYNDVKEYKNFMKDLNKKSEIPIQQQPIYNTPQPIFNAPQPIYNAPQHFMFQQPIIGSIPQQQSVFVPQQPMMNYIPHQPFMLNYPQQYYQIR